MANPEHERILKRGVEVWNLWRKENPEIKPDLEASDLVEAELSGAHLQDVNLDRSILVGANLQGANLRNGQLILADLRYAKLQRSNLRGADLVYAKIDSAKFEACHVGSRRQAAKVDHRLGDWKRVHVGDEADFDPDHDPYDASYWLIVQNLESVQEALVRSLGEQVTNAITIDFTQAVWRELHLVEMGLRETLGDNRFTVQKADDRLAVTFLSPQDLQRGLEAVVVQLAALEAVEPQRVESMTVRPPDGEVIVLEPAELRLENIAAQMKRLEGMVDRRLPAESDLMDASVENLLDKIPGVNLFTPALVWLYRQGREHFELLHRRRDQEALVGERRLLSPGEDPEDES